MAKVNYTPEQVEEMKSLYAEGMGVAELVERLGRSKKSVVAKLSREGVYQKPEPAPKAAKDEGPTKKEMLRELESLVPFNVDGLMNATKEAIQGLIDHLRAAEADTAEVEAE